MIAALLLGSVIGCTGQIVSGVTIVQETFLFPFHATAAVRHCKPDGCSSDGP